MGEGRVGRGKGVPAGDGGHLPPPTSPPVRLLTLTYDRGHAVRTWWWAPGSSWDWVSQAQELTTRVKVMSPGN